MSRRESHGEASSRRPPSEPRDAKRPRHEMPPVRLFVVSNLDYHLADADVQGMLRERNIFPFGVFVSVSGSGGQRGKSNSGSALVQIREDEPRSLDLMKNLDNSRFGSRLARVAEAFSFTVCVRGVRTDREAVGFLNVAREEIVEVRTISNSGDSLVCFVDLKSEDSFLRALDSKTPSGVLVSVGLRRRTDSGRPHDAQADFEHGRRMDQDRAYEMKRERELGRGRDGSRSLRPGSEHGLDRHGLMGRGRDDGHDADRWNSGDGRPRNSPRGGFHGGNWNRGGDHDPRGFERDWGTPRGGPPPGNYAIGGGPHGPSRDGYSDGRGNGRGFDRGYRAGNGPFVPSPPRRSGRDEHHGDITSEASEAYARAVEFYRLQFEMSRAWHVANLPFSDGLGHKRNVEKREGELRHCLEKKFPGIGVQAVFLMGRKGGSACVLLDSQESFSMIPREGSRVIFDHRQIVLGQYSSTMRVQVKGFGGRERLEDLKNFLSSDKISYADEHENILTVWDEPLAVLKMCAVDGYDGPLHVENGRTMLFSVIFSVSGGGGQGMGPRQDMHPARASETSNERRWHLGVGNVPRFASRMRVVRFFKIELGIETWLNAEQIGDGLFRVSGIGSRWYQMALEANGRKLFGNPPYAANQREVTVFPLDSDRANPTPDRRGDARSPFQGSGRRSGLSPRRRDGSSSRSQGHLEHAGNDRGDAYQEHKGVRTSGEHWRSGERPYRSHSGSQSGVHGDDQPRRSRGDADGDHVYRPSPNALTPVSSRPASDRTSGPPAKRVAAASGISRGFRASPVTPTPAVEFLAVGSPGATVPPMSLPSVAERVARIGNKVATRMDGASMGDSFEELFRALMGRSQQWVIDEVMVREDEEDTPKTQHVWSGLMFMEGMKLGGSMNDLSQTGQQFSDDCHPSHCNGFVVVKRKQSADVVNKAIAMLPVELNITYRIGWDSMRHMHVIEEDAVVFMVRSSVDVLDEGTAQRPLVLSAGESGRGRVVLSAIDSQKAVLGMLRNLRDKQRIGVCRYGDGEKLVALCIPPSAHAFEKLAVPWRFREMAGHDTILLVVGPANAPDR